MAEQTLRKVEDQLNCSICLETYTSPRLLQCFHVYCLQCLKKLVNKNEDGQLVVPCPTCRFETPVPVGGVASLQSAFNINYLLDILEEHKAKELNSNPDEKPTLPETPSTSIRKSSHLCPVHNDEELKLYCQTCGELICLKCVIKDEVHQHHDYELLDKAFHKHKREIAQCIEQMEEQLTAVDESAVQIEARCMEIADHHTLTESKVTTEIQRLHNALDARKDQLMRQLCRITQGKLKSLTTQKDEVEMIQVRLKSFIAFMKESLQTDGAGDVLQMKKIMMQQAESLKRSFSRAILKPNAEADVQFSSLEEEATGVCKNYGDIQAPNSPNPAECHLGGRGTKEAVVGKKSMAILGAVNFKGEPCTEPLNTLQCTLVSDITECTVDAVATVGLNAVHEITYSPLVKGWHKLHIKIDGKHVRGSPFAVTVKSPIESLGAPIMTKSNVKKPWGIVVNQKGEVIVTESSQHCITVFSPMGKKIRSFGSHGSRTGQFKSPRGVAVDDEGNILVVDCYNHRIQKFTGDGHLINTAGIEGGQGSWSPMKLHCPHGIAYNSYNNKVYVLDCNNHVQILNSDLTYYKIFGRKGSVKGHFNNPHAIACDSKGKVYIADKHNNRVQVFTAEGRFLHMIGKHGEAEGDLALPVGVAVDSNAMVYVTERDNYRVSVFTADGRFVTSFGRKGDGPEAFKAVAGVTVDGSGVVYVCDYENNCYKAF